jgi:RNA polymerase sigma-70 factor (ECF subfamily)
MYMEASQAMADWAGDGQPPFPNPPIDATPAPDVHTRGDQPLEERFEAEAMPHLNDLFRTALRMTGERGHAEDVLQEVYLQAWRSFERFEPGTNCRAWLYKILFHCVSHQRRKWFRFPSLKENEEFLEANLVQPATVAQEITDGEVLAALDKLPSEFRSVVLLVDVEEFAYKEVADILSVPIGTVMSRLSRGRGLLRKHLAELARTYGIGKGLQKENRL